MQAWKKSRKNAGQNSSKLVIVSLCAEEMGVYTQREVRQETCMRVGKAGSLLRRYEKEVNMMKLKERSYKRKVMKAVKGSGGLLSVISKRCGIPAHRIRDRLQRKSWKLVLKRIQDEIEKITDAAEMKVIAAIEKCADWEVSTKNARWYLEKRSKEKFGNAPSKLEVEHKHEGKVELTIESLDLPLEVRLAILEAAERHGMKEVPCQVVDQFNQLPFKSNGKKKEKKS